MLPVVDGGAPRVDFLRAALHQRYQPIEVVDGNDLVALFRDEMEEPEGIPVRASVHPRGNVG